MDQFNGIVSNITVCYILRFHDRELLKEGRDYNRVSHISMKFLDNVLARVLVDTISSLNVMLKSTLAKLSCKETMMRSSAMIVKAFDGS